MKWREPIQTRCKAGHFDALANRGTRNTHRFNGIRVLGGLEGVVDRAPEGAVQADAVEGEQLHQ
jgi:hypothetical protein